MGKRLVQVARGVQHVGRDDQVPSVGLEALVHRVLLDVQHAVVDGGVRVAEARLRIGEESRGDVGVHVVEPSGGKLGQDAVGRRADAGTHLQHPQQPPLRQLVDERANHLPHHPVRRPPHRGQPIQIAGRRLRITEQQRQRVLVAAEHRGQGAGAAPKQPDLVRRVREALRQPGQKHLGIARHPARQRLVGSDRDHEALVLRPQHT